MSHKFIPLNFYICTLPFESFESIETNTMDSDDSVATAPHASKLKSAKAFSLSHETVSKIEILLTVISQSLT